MLKNVTPHKFLNLVPFMFCIIEDLAQDSCHGTGPPTLRCHVRTGGPSCLELSSLM